MYPNISENLKISQCNITAKALTIQRTLLHASSSVQNDF